MIYDNSKSEFMNIFNAINEQSKLQKETNDLIRQMLAFWNKLEREDYYEEMVKKDGIRLP